MLLFWIVEECSTQWLENFSLKLECNSLISSYTLDRGPVNQCLQNCGIKLFTLSEVCEWSMVQKHHSNFELSFKVFSFADYLNPSTIVTVPFNNIRTLKSELNWQIPTIKCIVNQMFGGSSQFPTLLSELCSTIWFDYRVLGSSWKLGGVANTFDCW